MWAKISKQWLNNRHKCTRVILRSNHTNFNSKQESFSHRQLSSSNKSHHLNNMEILLASRTATSSGNLSHSRSSLRSLEPVLAAIQLNLSSNRTASNHPCRVFLRMASLPFLNSKLANSSNNPPIHFDILLCHKTLVQLLNRC